MQCTKNTELQLLAGAPACFVRDSQSCQLVSRICPGITLSMSFALVVTVYSSQNPRGRPTSMEHILAPPFLICTYYPIRYV